MKYNQLQSSEKINKVDYSLRFINSVINEFQKSKDHGDESLIIPFNVSGITEVKLFTSY